MVYEQKTCTTLKWEIIFDELCMILSPSLLSHSSSLSALLLFCVVCIDL